MDILQNKTVVIPIQAGSGELLKTYLRIFLAKIRLTENQLDVASALIPRYAQYVNDGVREPYASTLLFSTKNRKDIAKELKISQAHMNNTFSALLDKGILAKNTDIGYMLDPGLVPCNELIFRFSTEEYEKQRQDTPRSVEEVEPTPEPSRASSIEPTEPGAYNNDEQNTEDSVSEESGLLDTDIDQEESLRPKITDHYE